MFFFFFSSHHAERGRVFEPGRQRAVRGHRHRGVGQVRARGHVHLPRGVPSHELGLRRRDLLQQLRLSACIVFARGPPAQ